MERRTNRISLFRPGLSCICSPENAAVATYESAEIGCGRCEGRIRHNLLPDRNIERRKGEDMLRFVGGWSQGCQASSGLSAPSGIPCQTFAWRGSRTAAWQGGRLRLRRKIESLWQFCRVPCDGRSPLLEAYGAVVAHKRHGRYTDGCHRS